MRVSEIQAAENTTVTILRLFLGVMFMWLGLLKVAGYESSTGVAQITVPYFGFSNTTMVFGLVELAIGVLLLINIFGVIAEGLLVIYMLGTLLVFLAIPDMFFSPEFPLFTGVGEVVFKNLALGIAGISAVLHEIQLSRSRKE